MGSFETMFVYDSTTGLFSDFTMPPGPGYPAGINNRGDVVGRYVPVAGGSTSGFLLTTVPLPASGWLALGMFASLVVVRRVRRAIRK